jgi:hypothetical protein
LEQLGLEEGQGVFKRVGLGAWEVTTDSVGVQSVHDKVVDQEVKGVLQSTSVVASEVEVKRLDCLLLALNSFGHGVLKASVNNVLSLELVQDLSLELGRAHVLGKLGSGRERELVSFWDHTL